MTIRNDKAELQRSIQEAVKGKGRQDGNVVRIDFAEVPRLEKTEEGYLRGYAKVARIGVQEYQNADGSVRRELRHPEDVFAKEAIDSFRMIPITLSHPSSGLVTSENASDLAVGYVGESIHVDGRWLVMPLLVTDQRAIEAIEDEGVDQLSGGYLAEVEDQSGTWDGIEYDSRQRNIRGNHVAIVSKARAGDEARMNLDSEDAVAVADGTFQSKQNPQTTRRNDNMQTETIKIDGINYEVPAQVAVDIAKKDQAIEAAEQAAKDAKADAEKEKARADEAEAEKKKLEDQHSDEAIADAVKARLDLERKAVEVLGDDAKDIESKSDRELMVDVVDKVHPGEREKLDKAEDTYLGARFDAAIATVKSHSRNDQAQRRAVGDDGGTPPASGRKDAAEKEKEAANDIRGMHKGRNKDRGKGGKDDK